MAFSTVKLRNGRVVMKGDKVIDCCCSSKKAKYYFRLWNFNEALDNAWYIYLNNELLFLYGGEEIFDKTVPISLNIGENEIKLVKASDVTNDRFRIFIFDDQNNQLFFEEPQSGFNVPAGLTIIYSYNLP